MKVRKSSRKLKKLHESSKRVRKHFLTYHSNLGELIHKKKILKNLIKKCLCVRWLSDTNLIKIRAYMQMFKANMQK